MSNTSDMSALGDLKPVPRFSNPVEISDLSDLADITKYCQIWSLTHTLLIRLILVFLLDCKTSLLATNDERL
jgi:hypothetical protein